MPTEIVCSLCFFPLLTLPFLCLQLSRGNAWARKEITEQTAAISNLSSNRREVDQCVENRLDAYKTISNAECSFSPFCVGEENISEHSCGTVPLSPLSSWIM